MMPAKQTGVYADRWADIAKQVKDDAGWKCVRCNQAHGPAADGECLTVHHFDGNKCNNELWNLMALCQRCHLSVQARVDPQVSLLTQPSHWAMPYIAGFYEAGFGIPSPAYELGLWIRIYEGNNGAKWPDWAPTPQEKS